MNPASVTRMKSPDFNESCLVGDGNPFLGGNGPPLKLIDCRRPVPGGRQINGKLGKVQSTGSQDPVLYEDLPQVHPLSGEPTLNTYHYT
jgi:hypothetical protein